METRLVLSVIGLCLTLPMTAAVIVSSLRPGGRAPYLALVFLEAGLYFLGELLFAAAGRTAIGLALNYGSMLYGLPALFLFARDAMAADGAARGARDGGRGRTVLHFAPAIVNLPIGVSLAILCAARGYRGGTGVAAYLLALEIGQTAQLFAYGRASLRLAPKGPGSRWPRRVVAAVIGGYGAYLALSWAGIGVTLVEEISGRPVPAPSALGFSSLMATVLYAWTTGLCAIWGRDVASRTGPRYGGRPFPATYARALVGKVRALLAAEKALDSPAVEPRRIASRLGVPYHVLSRAVNEGESMTLTDLLNGERVARAKRILVEAPRMGILDVAHVAGFNAKSTFNKVFRKWTGMSPGEYRERYASRRAASAEGPPRP